VVATAGEIEDHRGERHGAGTYNSHCIYRGDRLTACLPAWVLRGELRVTDAATVGGASHDRVPAAGIGILTIVGGPRGRRVSLGYGEHLEYVIREDHGEGELFVTLGGGTSGYGVVIGIAYSNYGRSLHRVYGVTPL
jgi:hypothetical protein